jgi:hypothetical protein
VLGFEAGESAESGACGFEGAELAGAEFPGAELAGVEFCAHTPILPARNKTKHPVRIELFYRPQCVLKPVLLLHV